MKNVIMVSVGDLMPNPDNPRHLPDTVEERRKLELLSQDMKRRGVLVPLLVEGKGAKYLVRDGNRRLAAALLGKIEKLPCIPVDGELTPEQAMEIGLVTSLQKGGFEPAGQGACLP